MSYVTADFYGGTYLIARVGAPNVWDGVLRLWNRSNSYYTEFRAVAFATDIALNLPDSFPSDNTYLKHTSGGTLTWAAAASGTSATTFATLTGDYLLATKITSPGTSGFNVVTLDYVIVNQYGSVDSNWIVEGRVYGGIGTFGTIHNYPTYTPPATYTADLYLGTHARYGTITSDYATFGTLGTFRSPYAIVSLAELTNGIFSAATVLGTFRSLYGSYERINGAVGTFGTIHNFPEYTPPATYSGDLFVGPRGSFSTVVVDLISAINGGIDDLNVNNVYGDTATLNSAKISFNIRVATIAGQYGTFEYLYGAVGTFGTIHNFPTTSLPATYGADFFTGTRIWAATFVGNQATLGYISLANGQFTVGTALTWVGNFLGFGTRYGSVSYAATRMGSYGNITQIRYGSIYGGYGSCATVYSALGTFGTLRGRYGTVAQFVASEAQFGTIYSFPNTFATIKSGYGTIATLWTESGWIAQFSGATLNFTQLSVSRGTFSGGVRTTGLNVDGWATFTAMGVGTLAGNVSTSWTHVGSRVIADFHYGTYGYIGYWYGTSAVLSDFQSPSTFSVSIYAQSLTGYQNAEFPDRSGTVAFTKDGTHTLDYAYGTIIRAATIAVGYGSYVDMGVTHATFYTRAVGNDCYFGTVRGSNVARSLYNSAAQVSDPSSSATTRKFFDDGGIVAHVKILVPFMRYGGEAYLRWTAYHESTIADTGISYEFAVGSLNVSTTIGASSSGWLWWNHDISGIAVMTPVIATVSLFGVGAGDDGTLSNVMLDILSR